LITGPKFLLAAAGLAGAFGSGLTKAEILTVSVPVLVLAVTVTTLDTLLAPLPLNLTVNLP